jgi:hypothetical protein
MTLLIVLTTAPAVYMSADFRLTFRDDRIEDDPPAQKLLPVFKYGWTALVGFAGLARTRTWDVQGWLAAQLQQIPMTAPSSALEEALTAAEARLRRVSGDRRFTLTATGFDGTKPFAMLISNYQDLDGSERPIGALKVSRQRPGSPRVFLGGDQRSLSLSIVRQLRAQSRRSRDPLRIQGALAKANAQAAAESSRVSPSCFTAHLLRDGTAECTPHGIPDDVEFIPSFVREQFLEAGLKPEDVLRAKRDDNGNPLPRRLVGMTATRQQSDPALAGWIYAFRNVEEPERPNE